MGRAPGRGFSPGQLAARAAALPVVTYPDLPVSAHRDAIAQAIRDHQVVIVAGETGSGKTTQLPKICLELGRGIGAMIGHTQPRRLAARAVAERIAEELGQKVSKQVGDVIGYQVRFTDEVGPTTLVKLMTDGILLAEMGVDPLLKRYDTIIVDEAHERSLNIDFILGYLGRILPKRPDLKVIITSATIDSDRFAKHFEKLSGQPAPVIEVSGRAYPVEVRYRPLALDDAPTEDPNQEANAEAAGTIGTQLVPEPNPGDYSTLGYGLGEDLDIETALTHAVDELLTEDRGDILVFLPGERDILEAAQALKDHLGSRYVADERDPHRPDGIEVLPLFARLSAAEQHRIYAPHSLQRIILSTNIAETSLTVPGIRYVIDAGLARISRFSNKTKVQRLPIEGVSQASAAQRAGRAGRTSPGIAIRLYSERDFNQRSQYTEPEILRTSLAAVILQMAALGLGEVKDFPFLDAPNPRAVRDGVQLLTEIGALTPDGQITSLGRRLAQLPIDPRLGRMLIEADRKGCASEVLVIVAALSIQDPRERPVEFQEAADQAHRRYADPSSDFITYLNMWRYLNAQARDLSGSAFRRLCKREFFHYLRFREWRDIVGQLRQMCRQVGIKVERLGTPSPSFIRSQTEAENPVISAVLQYGESTAAVPADHIHRAILSGLLSNIGSWDEPRREYAGTRGSRFTIWPGSTLRKRRPDWVMAAELVETSRLFARTVAGIKPEWVEEYASDLVKRTYSEPIWSRARGSAQVSEKVSLYGLTLIADRQVPLSRLGNHVLGRDWSTSDAQPFADLAAVSTELTARALAREMFLTHALVEGDWRENHWAFVSHNRQVMEEAEQLSERMRDPAIVPDEAIRYRFFDSRVPGHIGSAASFNKWWKQERRKQPQLLDYQLEELLPDGTLLDPHEFPTTWRNGDLELEVQYSFSPGRDEDGISIIIPLSRLSQVQPVGFDWLVPGLREELCVAMIRGLPKAKRRLLAPATQTGKEVAERLSKMRLPSTGQETPSDPDANGPAEPDGKSAPEPASEPEADPYSLEASLERLRSWGASGGRISQATKTEPAPVRPTQKRTTKSKGSAAPAGFAEAFKRVVMDIKGVDLTGEDLRAAKKSLPAHLRIGFRVVDERGAIIGASDSLPELQRRFTSNAQAALQSAVKDALDQALQRRGPTAPPVKPRPERAAPQEKKPPAELGRDLVADNISSLPESALPLAVETQDAAGLLVRGYPAASVVRKDGANSSVSVRIFPTKDEAWRDHEEAVATLLLRKLRLETGRVTSRWTGKEALLLAGSPYPSTPSLVEDAQRAAIASLLQRSPTPAGKIRSAADLDRLASWMRDRFEDEVHATMQRVIRDVQAFARVQEAASKHPQPTYRAIRKAVLDHANSLFYAGYLADQDPAAAQHVSRFLQADAERLLRAASSAQALNQDRQRSAELAKVQQAVADAQARLSARPYSRTQASELATLNLLVEELRVSLFAQSLGTSTRVSPQRLLRRLQTLEQN